MNPLLERVLNRSVESLVRVACIAALVGLAVMSASILFPTPLLVIFAMSAGHAIGAVAVLCYVAAILMDLSRKARASRLPPPPSSSGDARERAESARRAESA